MTDIIWAHPKVCFIRTTIPICFYLFAYSVNKNAKFVEIAWFCMFTCPRQTERGY